MSATPDPVMFAEQSAIGALLNGGTRAHLNGLGVEHFGDRRHQLIYRAILDELDDSGRADLVTVFDRLERNGDAESAGGLPYLNALAQNVPSAAGLPAYAKKVQLAARDRRVRALLAEADEVAQRDAAGAARLAAKAAELIEVPEGGLRVLDLAALAAVEPRPPRFVVDDWLPEGEATLFAGHGGSGKSYIALTLAVCIAIGRSFFGLRCSRRRVLFWSYEDGEHVLHWRLRRICDMLGVDLTSLAGWLVAIDATLDGRPLFVETRESAGTTEAFEQLRRTVRQTGAAVLMIDGISDAFDANENSRAHVRAFVRAVRSLVPADGAALLIGHVEKAAAKSPGDALGFSGSTAWTNSVRARWYLRPDDDAAARLLIDLKKSNHGPIGAQIAVRFNDAARCFVADGELPAIPINRAMRESDERAAVLEVIRAADVAGDPMPTAARGERTAHSFAEARGLPESLRGKRGRARFYQHVEALRAAGAVRVDAIPRPNRHYAEVYRATAPATERASATERLSRATGHDAQATEH